MATTNPSLLPYDMPDRTKRRPIFDRLSSEKVRVGHWELNEDSDCPGYPEGRDLTVAALVRWLSRTTAGGIRINLRPAGGGEWVVGDRTFSTSFTHKTLLGALVQAAHAQADADGVAP